MSTRIPRRLFAFFRPYLGWAFLGGVGITTKEACRLTIYLVLGQALDAVLGVSSTKIEKLLIIECLLAMGVGIGAFTAVSGGVRATKRPVHDFRLATVVRILRKPAAFFEERRTGDLVSRLSNDGEAMLSFTDFVCLSAISRNLMLLLTLGVMLYLDWRVALVNFIILPVGYLLSQRATRPLEKKNTTYQERLGKATAAVSDAVQGAVEMKAFGMERDLGEAHDRAVNEMVRAQDDIARTSIVVGAGYQCASVLPLVASYGLGAVLVLRGEMTPGEVLAMQNAIYSFSIVVDFVFEFFTNLRSSTAGGRRVFELWDSPDEDQMGEAPEPPATEEAAVAVDDVGFSYGPPGGAAPWVFRGLSLSVKRGESVAIVGRSGCGKTTLLRLIAGFYVPQEGSVRVLGRRPMGRCLAEARKDVALVSQDPFLFPVSIRTNIAHGRGDGERAQADVEPAARKAGIHDYVLSLPRGYDSLVGERGVKLSGGQRQRVAIARAFYKDAPLLLLDEPTSSLDSATENQVQQSIAELMAGRTTIVVAHRLSTIKSVDRIYVMEKGSIVESGTHEQLLAAGGLYRELYRRQTSEESGAADRPA